MSKGDANGSIGKQPPHGEVDMSKGGANGVLYSKQPSAAAVIWLVVVYYHVCYLVSG